MATERYLVFNWHNTTKLHTILLCFAPPGGDLKISDGQNLIAWCVVASLA
ncbi:hypothetical protein PHLCEN_2v5879 [Hermanssonia centrifuga]|uniref:Uncharacterized protein n=1 Tax=Hermanssonia centrifuga TaxID=98765 RepID=A0A2R6P158_9APHY|nr:hypothetical protein PHLCEN_2v5879 [Hermanssonia centrifuga]